MARPLRFVALAAAAVVGWAATPAGPANPPPDVVLVTIDTLRADRLSGADSGFGSELPPSSIRLRCDSL